MTITIVIPTFNRSGLLLRAVDSVRQQTWPNWKLVVVDNASADDTPEVMAELMRSDGRIRYHRHPENIGMLANWEFAISQVDTAHFSLLCDDDYLLPDFFQAAAREMARHPELGLCFGFANVVDDEGKKISIAPNPMVPGYYPAGAGAAAMMAMQHPATPAIVFRTECFKAAGGIDRNSLYVADLDMILRVAIMYPVKFFEEESACYVVHAGNSFKDVGGWHPGLLNLVRNLKKLKQADPVHVRKVFRSFSKYAVVPLFGQFLRSPVVNFNPDILLSACRCTVEMRQVSNTLSGLLFAILRRVGSAIKWRLKLLWQIAVVMLTGMGHRIFLLEHGTLTEIERAGQRACSQPAPTPIPAAPVTEAGEGGQKTAASVVGANPSYAQDGLYTLHCADFMKDERFARAYAAGEATGSWSGAAVHWRVYVACWLAERASSLEGDLIECGVNRGGISRAIVSYLGAKLQGRRFYLLDTFQGIPVSILSDREMLHNKYFKENYTECYQDVLNTFREFPQVSVVRGLVPDTFGSVDSGRFCFAHIDMNNAISEIAAAEYLWPRLAVGGFMLLDDYAWEINVDQRQAFDRFARQRDMTVLALPTGQGLLMKTREAGEI